MIQKSEITVPVNFQGYFDKAGDDDLLTALSQNTKRFRKLLKDIPRKKIDYAYAEGKWTIRELLQHIIDAERVFVLRALWFTRRDPAPQPPFDENTWAANAEVTHRKWKDMVEEFFSLRRANELFFASLSEEALLRTGTASGNSISTIALGYISAGHVQHHIDIIGERYLAAPEKKTKDKKKKKKEVAEEA